MADYWYVDGDCGTDGGDPQGTGPGALAFKTIQYALEDARVKAGDTIEVTGVPSFKVFDEKGSVVEGVTLKLNTLLSLRK